MNKVLMLIRQTVKDDLRLYVSPVFGVFDEIKKEVASSPPVGWKQFMVNDIRLYFAPITGAFNGVKKELEHHRITTGVERS